jgi:hypothetical protein
MRIAALPLRAGGIELIDVHHDCAIKAVNPRILSQPLRRSEHRIGTGRHAAPWLTSSSLLEESATHMSSTHDHTYPATILLELDGYRFPDEYRWLRLNGFRSMTPWRCIDELDEATTIRKEFLLEVAGGSIPIRDFLPFARNDSTDDFAGFIQSRGIVTGEVCVAHLTFRGSAEVANYPTHTIYPSIWEWLTMVLKETRQWCQPQAVKDLEESAAAARRSR